MRIVVHGQQAFGEAVLQRLIDAGENVVAVCTAPDKEGRPIDPLKQLALDNGLPVHQPVSWKTDEAAELMRSFDADVCMMAYVLLFVPSAVLDIPTHGSFQYHPSLLPMHRGPSSINWPIATGSTKTGLTIFWPDDGLDEGPILMQKECSIGPDETLGDIYFSKLFPMGVDAMIESLALVKEGNAPRVDQDLSLGTYESWFGKKEAELNWSLTANEVYNVIRAGNPQPGAWTIHEGSVLKLFDSRIGTGSGKPGEVLKADEKGIEIAAGSGSVIVSRVRGNGGKQSAGDYISESGLSVGTQLG